MFCICPLEPYISHHHYIVYKSLGKIGIPTLFSHLPPLSVMLAWSVKIVQLQHVAATLQLMPPTHPPTTHSSTPQPQPTIPHSIIVTATLTLYIVDLFKVPQLPVALAHSPRQPRYTLQAVHPIQVQYNHSSKVSQPKSSSFLSWFPLLTQ